MQAADFERAIAKTRGKVTLRPALDFEDPTPSEWSEKGVVPTAMAPLFLSCWEAVERLLWTPITYTYGDFVAHLPRSGPSWLSLCELAERSPLWAACGPHYLRDGKLPREDDDTPDVPGDGEQPPLSLFAPWKSHALWQFGGGGVVNGKYVGNFRCPGINGYVDCNVLDGMAEDLRVVEPNEGDTLRSVPTAMPTEALEHLRDGYAPKE
jgi:hypothetical protein